ncbi:type II toxin-antitoxin system RelE/ParE family toxin [Psychromarinibacter sp. C21-152]|uniref:Type II toxin-antitoxin system RelE/ParE family toxin n=1 Tax=Psychromarinibacter sediminicola TaxID=3033385 RepID=A0AAE3NS59_9RHOB|nr:type II toxin-antitoxin system RelE/ParE family toxin [Psychromarinibacter sediminicola]MDF0599552.1 type II toxin-antitoxin system RelE/ParE family toxin [Psychromarinibacter sediminicola]
MRIVWHPDAEADLEAGLQRSAGFGAATAMRLLARVDAAVGHLAEHPQMARPGRVDGTRELVLRGFPYILVYRADPESVTILAVRHAARDWPRSFPNA